MDRRRRSANSFCVRELEKERARERQTATDRDRQTENKLC